MTRGMTAVSPVVGSMLERYRIGDVLGHGGMGEVLSARDEQIGRDGRDQAAARRRTRAPEVLARFLREARIQGRLEHPAIVPGPRARTDERRPAVLRDEAARRHDARRRAPEARAARRARERVHARSACCARSPTSASRSSSRTRAASSTAISSRRTSCSATSARSTSSTGASRASPRPSDETARQLRRHRHGRAAEHARRSPARCSARPATCRPSRSAATATSTAAPTSTRSAASCSRSSRCEPLHPRGQAALASRARRRRRAAVACARRIARSRPSSTRSACRRPRSIATSAFATARELGDAVQRFLDGDRDLALRRELAHAELAAARAALAARQRPERAPRCAARRGRALALDPTRPRAGRSGRSPDARAAARDAAPRSSSELEGLDLEALRTSARFGMLAAIAYLAFFPILVLGRVSRRLGTTIAGPALCIGIILDEIFIAPTQPVSVRLHRDRRQPGDVRAVRVDGQPDRHRPGPRGDHGDADGFAPQADPAVAARAS